jgi:hypothetical protein
LWACSRRSNLVCERGGCPITWRSGGTDGSLEWMGVWLLAMFARLVLWDQWIRGAFVGRPCKDDDKIFSASLLCCEGLSFRSFAVIDDFGCLGPEAGNRTFEGCRLIDIKVRLEARAVGHDHNFFFYFLPIKAKNSILQLIIT